MSNQIEASFLKPQSQNKSTTSPSSTFTLKNTHKSNRGAPPHLGKKDMGNSERFSVSDKTHWQRGSGLNLSAQLAYWGVLSWRIRLSPFNFSITLIQPNKLPNAMWKYPMWAPLKKAFLCWFHGLSPRVTALLWHAPQPLALPLRLEKLQCFSGMGRTAFNWRMSHQLI